MTDGALPEKYRRATNIKVGYEIRLKDGTWAEVATQMHVTSPANFVTFTLTNGVRVTQHPRDEIMSRKVAVVAP